LKEAFPASAFSLVQAVAMPFRTYNALTMEVTLPAFLPYGKQSDKLKSGRFRRHARMPAR
jgi:hypothetical protein